MARNAEALDGLVREIEAADGSAIGVPCDVGREMDVARAIEAAIRTYGRIDTWVNNAGMRMAR